MSVESKIAILIRLFNWIKYKTLPPSINFKNRLFIERDNKHKRILSNLGLTFRNSKWSDYHRSNLSHTSLLDFKFFFKTFLLSLVFILFICSFNKYFLLLNFTTKYTTFVWFLFDTSFYTKSLIISSSFLSLQLLLDKWIFQSLSTSTPASVTPLAPLFTKNSQKIIFYQWLVLNTTHSSDTLTKLFSNPSQPTVTNIYLQVKNLFKLTSTWRLSSLTTNVTLTGLNATLQLNPFNSINPAKYFLVYADYSYQLNNHKDLTTNLLDLWSLQTSNFWNCSTLTPTHDMSLTKIKKGVFYTLTHDFNEMLTWANTHELRWLPTALHQQTQFVKLHRWLYKYNILHRKLITNSHKNTLTKRLISSGFYDSKFNSHNLYSNSLRELHPTYAKWVSMLYLQTYKPQLNTLTPSTSSFTPTMLSLLSFHETSYFWFIKRFYNFNTLPTHLRETTWALTDQLTHKSSTNHPNTITLLNTQLLQTQISSLTIPNTGAQISSNTLLDSLVKTTNLRPSSTLVCDTTTTLYSRDWTELMVNLTAMTPITPNVYFYYSPLTHLLTTPSFINLEL